MGNASRLRLLPTVSLRSVARHLRFRPFPSDSEESRAAERYRRALWTMVANLGNRAIGMLGMVLSVSWTVPYLGAERFGAWMTIASLAAVLSFMDLGVGNGLTNRIAHAASSSDRAELPRAIAGGLGVLAVISVLLLGVLACGAWLAPWHLVVKASSDAVTEEVRITALVFAVLFSLSIFLNGVLRIHHGMQRGFEVFAVGTVCSLVVLLLLYVATQYRAGLPLLLACSMGAALLPGLWLWFRLARGGLFRFAEWPASTRHEWPMLSRISLLFLVLQLGTAIGWSMDSLIISSTLGASAVAAFALTQRLYFIATQPVIVFNSPLWPAYADADARSDHAFIRKTLFSAAKLTLAYSLVTVGALFAFSQPILRHWTSGGIEPAMSLVFALGVWAVLEALGNCFAMFLNGTGIVRPQVIVVIVIVAVGLPLKLLLAQTAGIPTMMLGFAALFAAVHLAVYGLVFRSEIVKKLVMPSPSVAGP